MYTRGASERPLFWRIDAKELAEGLGNLGLGVAQSDLHRFMDVCKVGGCAGGSAATPAAPSMRCATRRNGCAEATLTS